MQARSPRPASDLRCGARSSCSRLLPGSGDGLQPFQNRVSLRLSPPARTDRPTAASAADHSRQNTRNGARVRTRRRVAGPPGGPQAGLDHVRRRQAVPGHGPDLAAGQAQPGGDQETGSTVGRRRATVGKPASTPEPTMACSADGVNCSRVTCEADIAKLSSPSVHKAS